MQDEKKGGTTSPDVSGKEERPPRTTQWRPLKQLAAKPPKFPTDALGPILGPAAKAIAGATQTTDGLVAQSLLVTATLAAQSLACVSMHGRHYPIHNYFLTIADSGERKSTVARIASRAVREFEKRLGKQRQPTTEGGEHSPAESQIVPRLILEDVSLDGLYDTFQSGPPSIALIPDEAATFLGGPSLKADFFLRTIGTLSSIHSSGEIQGTARKGKSRARRQGVHLTIHLLVQPTLARSFLADERLWEQGLMGRFLIVNTRSLAGSRMYRPADPDEAPSVKTFHRRIRRLLEMTDGPVDRDERKAIRVLKLSPKAQTSWERFYNEVEQRQAAGQWLEEIKGVAGKAGEQALRLAAILTLVQRPRATKILLQEIENSCRLVRHYLIQAKRMYSGGVDPHVRAALDLMAWLQKQDEARVSLKRIYQCGPSRVRSSAKARKAISILEKHGYARLSADGRRCELRPASNI